MNMNWYKFGFSGMENSYYTPYECSSHLSTMDLTEQQPWNYPAMMNVEEPVAVETVETVESTSEENTAPSVDANPEHIMQKSQNSKMVLTISWMLRAAGGYFVWSAQRVYNHEAALGVQWGGI
nr:E3 ubiquitin ligase BIG BROTHER [Ipomoea trifida]GLL49871.1 E3 ubiquitin ligase BIG BROTHER [Ipomoea trifida]